MKIKKFKTLIIEEKIDIPDVFEKIKPIAYTKRISTEPSIKVPYKRKILIATFGTIAFVFLLAFVIPGGLKNAIDFNPEMSAPLDDDPISEAVDPSDSLPESPANDVRTYQQDYYSSLFDNIKNNINVTEADNVTLTDEQKETVLPPIVCYALYDIVVVSGITNYNSVLSDLIAWGKHNSYDATYFHDNNDEVLYVFSLLTE
jgi:hypothetical protein